MLIACLYLMHPADGLAFYSFSYLVNEPQLDLIRSCVLPSGETTKMIVFYSDYFSWNRNWE